MPLPTIPSGNVASALPTGYDVANSCRFNDGDSPSLHKSFSSASRTTYTISMWVKRSGLVSGALFYRYVDGNNYTRCFFEDDDLKFADVTSGSDNWLLITNRKFRDVASWYHIVVVCDTTNGTAGHRQRIYVNGVEETSFSTETNSATQGQWGVDGNHYIGTNSGSSYFFDGYIAEVCYIDGTALAPTSFGEFDEDSPSIWKPIDVSGLSFGTNGFYLDFEASGNLGNDANGGTDLTEANLAATDQATDTPTNNFCTLNTINPTHADLTIAEGSLKMTSSNSQWLGMPGTFGLFAGKWYAEFKYYTGYNLKIGILGSDGEAVNWLTANSAYAGYSEDGYEYQFNNSVTGYKVNNDSSPTWSGGTPANNNTAIYMMAVDLDNGKIWYGRDGTWFNSSGTANPATGSDAAQTFTVSDNVPWIISLAVEGSGASAEANFGGCPVSALSSAVADGNGYGAFEYAPPSGFYALCTKNLAEYG